MDDLQNIKFAIRKISAIDKTYSEVCTVTNIDTEKYLCDCTPVDGSAILINVRLIADNKIGFKLIPKENSIVVVTLINNTTGYISMCSEIDEIHLNGNNLDGIVKVNELVTKLNQLENKVNELILYSSTHIHSGGLIGGNTGPATPVVVGNLTPTVKNDLQNIKVKHGS